jgi:hypothetical protein
MRFRGVAITMLFSIQAFSQFVISTRSGLIDYVEGSVCLDGVPLSRINSRFTEIREGGSLHTNEGQAEVLLNPDVFLWLGPHSAIRMEQNSLSDVRVELLQGFAVIQAQQMLPGNAIMLLHGSSQVRVSDESLYRFDSSSSRLNVLAGSADVTTGIEDMIIEGPRCFNLSSGQVSPLPSSKPDAFDKWVRERRKLIAKERQSAEASLGKKHHWRSLARPFPASAPPLPRRSW